MDKKKPWDTESQFKKNRNITNITEISPECGWELSRYPAGGTHSTFINDSSINYIETKIPWTVVDRYRLQSKHWFWVSSCYFFPLRLKVTTWCLFTFSHRGEGAVVFLRAPSRGSGLLLPLPLVDLHVAPPLVAAGKLPATLFTGERFFTCVCADVRGQVIAAAKVPHADATLEWFVACVDPQVTTQLVGAGEPTVAALGRTRVWALMHRCLARSIRVLPGSEDRPQGQVLVGWECSCHRGLRGPQSVIPNSVERCERWSHAQRVQRVWEGLVSLAVLRVIPSVLGHNGQQCSALYGRFGCRVVGRWWVKGDSTGGCA